MSKYIKTLNIAPNYRGKARLWIEQANIHTICGFNKGDKCAVKYNAKSITIKLDSEGLKSVSGRTRNGRFIPIFEITNQAITEWCKANDCYQVSIEFEAGLVTIKPAKKAV